MTELEFASKIEWEGGPIEAVEYGLHSSELAEEGPLKDAWERFESVWQVHVVPALHNVESVLDGIDTDL